MAATIPSGPTTEHSHSATEPPPVPTSRQRRPAAGRTAAGGSLARGGGAAEGLAVGAVEADEDAPLIPLPEDMFEEISENVATLKPLTAADFE